MSSVVEPTPRRADGVGAAPARTSRSRFAGPLAFLPPALLAAGLIVGGVVRSSGRDGNDATSIATKELAGDLRDTPFTVRLPAKLPSDAPLIRTFLDKPDTSKGYQAYALNTWYTTAGGEADNGGRVIHVWQTNDNFIARELLDPTKAPGTPEVVAGATWHRVLDKRVRYHEVTAYSRRYPDGVTVVVDAANPSDARATIATLRVVASGGATTS